MAAGFGGFGGDAVDCFSTRCHFPGSRHRIHKLACACVCTRESLWAGPLLQNREAAVRQRFGSKVFDPNLSPLSFRDLDCPTSLLEDSHPVDCWSGTLGLADSFLLDRTAKLSSPGLMLRILACSNAGLSHPCYLFQLTDNTGLDRVRQGAFIFPAHILCTMIQSM